MCHTNYYILEDSSINITTTINNSSLHFFRLKRSVIGIYSLIEDIPYIFLGIEIRWKDKPFYDMHLIIQKLFLNGFINLNSGVFLLEISTEATNYISANSNKCTFSIYL